MKKVLVSVIVMSIIYLSGFAVITPAMLSSSGYLKGVLQSIFHHAYSVPISQLQESSSVRNLWNEVNIYWCVKVESCRVPSTIL